MKDGVYFIIMICLLILLLGCGLVVGSEAARTAAKKEAVSKGVAEFVATPEGKVEFRWKEPCK